MDNQQLRNHIMQKKEEIGRWMECLARMIELRHFGLTEETYDIFVRKINSRIAQCEISINDHEKLIT